jgi:RND family efflux transporter MFP subunit
MSLWKQLLLSVVVLAAAAALWVFYYPGADAMLARWGLGPAPQQVQQAQGQPPRQGGGRPGGAGQPTVVSEAVVTAVINDRLSAIGTGRALNSVIVTPFSAGRLTEILVPSGSRVAAGDVIARLDAEAEEIAADRARIALEDAQSRLERVRALRNTNTSTAVQVTEAELAVGNARLALREAELALDRRIVRAPIAGIVGILPITPGNYVSTTTEIATIDDRSTILVDFWVPERFASAISVGSPLSAMSIARGSETFEGRVSAIDNRIDPNSRTLRIQAGIDNPTDSLRAGMSFQVAMQFPGDSYPAVNPLAIQWSTEGAFVWAVRDGNAVRVPVRIVQRNTDSVLVDGDLPAGTQVVIEGVHELREGGGVRTIDPSGAPVAAGTGRTVASGT